MAHQIGPVHDSAASQTLGPTNGQAIPPQPSMTAADRRLVRLVAMMLLVQGVGLSTVAGWTLLNTDWSLHVEDIFFSLDATGRVVFALAVGLPGLLLLPAALGLAFARNSAWLAALTLQVLLLLGMLNVYFFPDEGIWRPLSLIYPIMASSIILVFYLNLSDVRTAVKRQGNGAGGEDHGAASF